MFPANRLLQANYQLVDPLDNSNCPVGGCGHPVGGGGCCGCPVGGGGGGCCGCPVGGCSHPVGGGGLGLSSGRVQPSSGGGGGLGLSSGGGGGGGGVAVVLFIMNHVVQDLLNQVGVSVVT